MAKIKGFKNPDLDFIGIQVIQISFKQFCSSPAFWWNSAVYFSDDGNRHKKSSWRKGKIHEVKHFLNTFPLSSSYQYPRNICTYQGET